MGDKLALWRWMVLAWLRPVYTCRMAAAGGAPVAELVTLTVVLSSLAVGSSIWVRAGSLTEGLLVAASVVLQFAIGVFVQVLFILLAARALGWKGGGMGDVFHGYGPSVTVNLALAVAVWVPEALAMNRVVLGANLAAQFWQWAVMAVGVQAVTGLSFRQTVLAILPAAVLWDVPLYVWAFRLLGR